MWARRARLQFKIPMSYLTKVLGLSEKRIRTYELNGNFPEGTFEKYKAIISGYTDENITKTNCECEDTPIEISVLDKDCGIPYNAGVGNNSKVSLDDVRKNVILAELGAYADILNSRGVNCLKSFARILATHPVYRIEKD